MQLRDTSFAAVAVALLCAALSAASSCGAAPSAEDVMTQNFTISKVADSTQDAAFRLINSQGQERVRETTGQTKLLPGTTDNRRIVVFTAPADIRGTKTLLIEHSGGDDDIWIYLPAMKKVRWSPTTRKTRLSARTSPTAMSSDTGWRTGTRRCFVKSH